MIVPIAYESMDFGGFGFFQLRNRTHKNQRFRSSTIASRRLESNSCYCTDDNHMAISERRNLGKIVERNGTHSNTFGGNTLAIAATSLDRFLRQMRTQTHPPMYFPACPRTGGCSRETQQIPILRFKSSCMNGNIWNLEFKYAQQPSRRSPAMITSLLRY